MSFSISEIKMEELSWVPVKDSFLPADAVKNYIFQKLKDTVATI